MGSACAAASVVLAPSRPPARLGLPVAAALGAVAGALASSVVLRHGPRLRVAELPRTVATLPPRVVLFLLLAATSEELLWRRLVLGGLLAAGTLAAFGVSTLGFALAHRKRPGLHLGTGAAFGGLYLVTGTLAAPVGAHWVYNALLLAALQGRAEAEATDAASPPAPAPAAELAEVGKRFGRTVALDGASFTVGEGEVVAVLGPNGAGKSTALSILLGVRRPEQGRAALFGRDPRAASARALVGVTPQETAFPSTLRVRELVELVRCHYRRPVPAQELFDRFELGGLGGRQVGGLSVGQRRRLGVALAFAGRPRLVVLDEPTAGLDREARLAVWEAARVHAREGGSLLLTTHQLDEADALAERVVVLDRGRVVADGPVAHLKATAGFTVVRFRAPPGGVEGGVLDGGFVRVLTADGGAEVERLVRNGVPLAELEVRPVTLEEALAAREAAE